MKPSCLIQLLALVAVVSGSGCWEIPSAASRAQAVKEAESLLAEMEASLASTATGGTLPHMYVDTTSESITLMVYRVVREDEQDRLVALARRARMGITSKTIELRFYKDETYTTSGNAVYRHDGRLLRTVTISGAEDEAESGTSPPRRKGPVE